MTEIDIDAEVRKSIIANQKIRFPTAEQIASVKTNALLLGLKIITLKAGESIKNDENSKFVFEFRRVK